eukprot:356349-Chlamydomonas_euryale.AAC.6
MAWRQCRFLCLGNPARPEQCSRNSVVGTVWREQCGRNSVTGTGTVGPRKNTSVHHHWAHCKWAGSKWAGCKWAGCKWAGCKWAGCKWAGRRDEQF